MRRTFFVYARSLHRANGLHTSSPLRSSLCGRDFLQPKDFTLQELKTLLWFAMDMKHRVKASNRAPLNIAVNKHVTLLFLKQNYRHLQACSLGCHLLGATATQNFDFDHDFESQPSMVDNGRALSQLTDLIVVNGCSQTTLDKLAEGSCAPVIGVSTGMYCPIKALAFLMTIQENFGHLKRLKLAWIGPSSSLCNTILSMYPTFGINIQFNCLCAHGTGLTTPMGLENAIEASNVGLSEIRQYATAREATYRAHVVITGPHRDFNNQVTIEMMEEADEDWIYLHPLPRSEAEVADSIFSHKKNLSWVSSENHLYVAMAMIASSLVAYEPKTPMPQFDNC